MVSIDIGAGAGAGAGAIIKNIVGDLVMSRSSADIRLIISEMIENEVLEEDQGPMTCTICRQAFDRNEDTCPFCGAVPGKENKRDESYDDNENEMDPEIPVHGTEEKDKYEELPISPDLSSRFEDLLNEMGWDIEDAEQGGLVLARMWETNHPVDEKSFANCLQETDYPYINQLNDELLKERVLQEFKDLAVEEEKEKQKKVQAEIYIYQDSDGDWVLDVDDPLNNLVLNKSDGRVALGKGFSISARSAHSLVEKRHKRLRDIGQQLIEFRQDFFEAATQEEAEEILDKQPLHQNELTKVTGIPTSTLSEWCQCVWVSSPHGVYLLGDFFERAAITPLTGNLTTEAIHEIIKTAIQDNEKLKENPKSLLEYLKKNHDIEMSGRTLHDYLSKISD